MIKGMTFDTKYFGLYREERETDLMAEEIVGTVHVNELNGHLGSFLYVRTKNRSLRYDLPAFMQKYDGQKVALLGRVYTKRVNGVTYDKICVISVKPLSRSDRE